MANEGQETVVEQNVDRSTTTDQNVDTSKTNDQTDTKKDATPAPGDRSAEYEKRISGITSDLQKERKARQQYERDLAAAKAEVEAERKRVQALAGLTPKSEAEAEVEAIRAQFAKLYPHLADLTEEDIQAIRENRERAAGMAETTQHYWVQHGRSMISGVVAEIEKELGGKLTDRQAQRIQAEYVREAEQNPDFLERHERGDKALAAEFAKQLVEDWFEPARRKVTQSEAQRFRAVPDAKGRGIVTQGEKKIDVTDSKAVEDLLVKGFRERNGGFSGRR